MRSLEFDKIMDRRFTLTCSVIGTKAGEYASDKDRLHNFKAAAAVLNCTPEQALLGMLTKHLVSVIDLVKAGASVPQAMADEKIGDCVNYLILLEALWAERRELEDDKTCPPKEKT